MPLSNLLIVICVVIFVMCLILFPAFRQKLMTLLGGFLNLFVEDAAKTPDGARAVYQQAIEDAQEEYNKADNTLKKLSGRLDTARNQLAAAKNSVVQIEKKAEAAVARGDDAAARIFAEQRQEHLTEIQNCNDRINQLEPAVKEAKHIMQQREKQLTSLKRKSKEVVDKLELNREMADAYDDLDELKRAKPTDKLLGIIDEEVDTTRERAVGSRIVHESKLSTQISNADDKYKSCEVDSYLAALKKKSK